MKKYSPIDLKKITTYPIEQRKNKVNVKAFAQPQKPGAGFNNFLESLPDILAARDFKAVVEAVVDAHRRKRPVLLAMGGHVIKCGLAPLLIDLINRGIITALALNGSASIHDYEISFQGGSSEDVAQELKTGHFGMADETGRGIHEALAAGDREGWGYGESLGRYILDRKTPFRQYSVLAAAAERKVPATVHVSIGTDIIHMHPGMDGRIMGEATFRDFRIFCSVVADLGQGGVFLNVGSAVVMPEVFLKAVSIARNLGHDLSDFVTVNFDMIQHYRPRENVVRRPTLGCGQGYAITGHHEIMIPLLARAIVEKLK
ncbi:MAG: hypothetical protein GXP58_04470 [Deltaproteobacteria bacterium]|nr:hypothetical protein [Deltaproteobacteria bacterium]